MKKTYLAPVSVLLEVRGKVLLNYTSISEHEINNDNIDEFKILSKDKGDIAGWDEEL